MFSQNKLKLKGGVTAQGAEVKRPMDNAPMALRLLFEVRDYKFICSPHRTLRDALSSSYEQRTTELHGILVQDTDTSGTESEAVLLER